MSVDDTRILIFLGALGKALSQNRNTTLFPCSDDSSKANPPLAHSLNCFCWSESVRNCPVARLQNFCSSKGNEAGLSSAENPRQDAPQREKTRNNPCAWGVDSLDLHPQITNHAFHLDLILHRAWESRLLAPRRPSSHAQVGDIRGQGGQQGEQQGHNKGTPHVHAFDIASSLKNQSLQDVPQPPFKDSRSTSLHGPNIWIYCSKGWSQPPSTG
jgi:hypothetical protein